MKRVLFGVLLCAHGLAHAGAGTWTSGRAAIWFVTALWVITMAGFIAAGLGVLGVPVLRGRWRLYTVVSAASSLPLLSLVSHPVAAVGIALDVLAGIIALTPSEWAELPAAKRAALHPVRTPIGRVLSTAAIAYVAIVVLLRPMFMTWGTTAVERRAFLPGDPPITDARYRIDHAVTIRAPADAVWPWLAQLGQDRAGFYSYDWLERLVGVRIKNADRLVPEWQERTVGDLVRATQPDYLGGIFGQNLGWRITELDAPRVMVLENWGAFVLVPIDSATTRLIVRTRGDGSPSLAGVVFTPVGLLVFEPAHFIMQRRMLLGIKERAEGHAADQAALPSG